MYKLVYSKKAISHIDLLKYAKLDNKAKCIIEIISNNPFKHPPPYEKLSGNLLGLYSRRINIKHRIVYEVNENIKTIKIISMWSHYQF